MRRTHWITSIGSALLATACASTTPPPTSALVETRTSVRVAEQNDPPRKDELARHTAEARRAAERARMQAELAAEQLQTAQNQADMALRQLDEVYAAAQREEAGATAEGNLEKLEQELAQTREQLAAKGTLADVETQALEDREVALQAQIDVLRVERDRLDKANATRRSRP